MLFDLVLGRKSFKFLFAFQAFPVDVTDNYIQDPCQRSCEILTARSACLR